MGQVFPYITYDINDYGMLNNGLNDVFIWTRTGNLQQLYSYLGEVRKALPEGGVTLLLPDNAGAIKLYRGNPFYQDYEQEDAAIKAGRILIQVNSYIY